MPTTKSRLKSTSISDFELFTRLNDAVSAEYWQDSCKAGVVTSKIRHDPPEYYVSIVRYHGYHSEKKVIAKGSARTLREALKLATKEWLTIVLPPPKEDLIERLADCFSGEELAAVRVARK